MHFSSFFKAREKIFSFFLILSLVFLYFSTPVNAAQYPLSKQPNSDFVFEIEDKNCPQDEFCEIPVKIKNNKGIWSGLFSVSIPNNFLENVTFEEGPLLKKLEYSKKITKTKVSLYFENKNLSDFKENGVLFYIRAKTKETAPVSKVNFTFSGSYDADDFINSKGDNVNIRFKNGTLSILKSNYVMIKPTIKSVKLKTVKKIVKVKKKKKKKTVIGAVVSYNKVQNATSYAIYRAAGKSNSYKAIKKTKSLSYKDTTIKAGVLYKYKIKAVNAKKTTDFSNIMSITSLNYKKKVKFDGSLLSPSSVELVIKKAPAGTVGYQVQYANNKKYINSKKKTTKSKTIKLTKLNSNYVYHIRVRAYNIVNGKKRYTKWAE